MRKRKRRSAEVRIAEPICHGTQCSQRCRGGRPILHSDRETRFPSPPMHLSLCLGTEIFDHELPNAVRNGMHSLDV